MEHSCINCGFVTTTSNNYQNLNKVCPQCGETMYHTFNEDSYDYEDYEEDDE